ncbi:aldolase/citrate lyase family protein [Alsobacter sp. SYSU M60028]|uniref:Aldolase/citrate lyase family protein n=1 Tax=Alsobacter ponti TaxID=2962936 RepID=A0ABT1LDA0_9HYPH|nr:aldolase/citrate lyase family protein [Alsobacter ponti]MCP8938916.1 aldolase/citrate lyase family protein [Alsobacter ponti]
MPSADAFAALSHRWGRPPGLLTAWLGIPSPILAGVVAREGVDCVTLDMQHGGFDLAAAVLGIGQVMLAGKPALVRVPVGDYATASRLLDSGAAGIIAPMVNSVADARALVEFTKFPPVGARSWGPVLAMDASGLGPADYLRRANGLTKAIAMVETRESLAALDDILAVEGVDGVFVGPSDLSITLSGGAHVDAEHKDVDAALDHVLARCRAAGKAACVFAPSGPRAGEMRRRGFDLVALANDVGQVRLGVKTMLEQAGAAKGPATQGY